MPTISSAPAARRWHGGPPPTHQPRFNEAEIAQARAWASSQALPHPGSAADLAAWIHDGGRSVFELGGFAGHTPVMGRVSRPWSSPPAMDRIATIRSFRTRRCATASTSWPSEYGHRIPGLPPRHTPEFQLRNPGHTARCNEPGWHSCFTSGPICAARRQRDAWDNRRTESGSGGGAGRPRASGSRTRPGRAVVPLSRTGSGRW